MIKRFASSIAVLAVVVALGLKLMVSPRAHVQLQRLSHGGGGGRQRNALLQTRVYLPDHVLGHPCLYYPNFISQEVASQVTAAPAVGVTCDM